jgi:biopolymer transport protein ExbD
MYYQMGKSGIAETRENELIKLFKDQEQINPELIILVKVDRAANYETMVDMMDALALAEMSRFSLVALPAEDARLVEGMP